MSFYTSEDSGSVQVLSQEGDPALRRIRRQTTDDDASRSITVLAAAESPAPNGLNRLIREFELAEYLDGRWALRPLVLAQENDKTILILEDPGGELLGRHLGAPMGVESFLRLAIGIAAAVSKMHQRGLVHKDLKPANIMVNCRDGEIRLTGFGIVSQVPRERQPPELPQFIAGTLAYMAPEQTGRMNRSIDSRSDLYALGVTFYQMLTGSLPFKAADAMEWIHCHIARQPASATSLVPDLPPTLSAIVAKLLAKAAEDRYQTAIGLEQDLDRCLASWEKLHRIDSFPLGEHDIPGRLLIPEKLYGRERDVDTLLAAFDSVLENGVPELVLVSGYSGIGKSAVVNELHRRLVLPRGLFASGKFDQYKRDIPYATLAQAFQGIIRQLLGQTEAELSKWREAFAQALGPNGLMITDLVPELKLIVGEQPALSELPPQETKARFQLVFQRFISVFARQEHPLALFLDDLQWVDAATLDLIENLLTQSDVRHLLMIGAYRDNEVDAAHPLMSRLEAIRKNGTKARHIVLAHLSKQDLTCLVTDSFHCDPDRARRLAQLISERTAGNPFFVLQFIAALVDEALITFDFGSGRWSWDLSRIDAKGYTDNVVDLMVGKLNRLPVETQEALQQLACLGNNAAIASLSMVCQSPEEKLHADLWEARRAELVLRPDGAYRFVHDRVQEAAYSLIPEEKRAEVHLAIGRLLLQHTPAAKYEEEIFEIVGQLNRGASLIRSLKEREQTARLNLMAARRAKRSTAYAAALAHVVAGCALLAPESWQRQYRLAFDLALLRAECEFLNGNFDEAEALLAELVRRCDSKLDQAAICCLKIELHTIKSENSRGVDTALECLRLFGIDMPPHPSRDQLDVVLAAVWRELEGRSIESLVDLRRSADPDIEAVMRVLQVGFASAYYTDETLLHLQLSHMVDITLRHGVTDASPHGFAWFGVLLGHVFGRYAEGYRFGRLACELIERHQLVSQRARTLQSLEVMSLWTGPIAPALDTVRAAFSAAVETGDIATACYVSDHIVTDLLLCGAHLQEVEAEAERALRFVRRAKYRDIVDVILGQRRFIANMRGHTFSFSTFDGDEFDSAAFDAQLTPARQPMMIFWYWVIKGKARFISGDLDEAVEAFAQARPLLWSSAGHIQLLDYHCFLALTLAALEHGDASAPNSATLGEELEGHRRMLERWAESCPTTFADKHALVSAEIARLEGRALDAERLYEQAIREARANGFVHNEAIAYEVAARFYAGRGFEEFARVYLQKAHHLYQRWGADGKVRQLEESHPQLREDVRTGGPTNTIATPVEHLDFATVVKLSQALSGEMVLERLTDTLLRLAIEHAAAERGVLLLSGGNELRQEAEAVTSADGIVVRRPGESAAALPATIVQYVVRAREIVILDDASTHPIYAADPYVLGCKARSVLCLPLVAESKMTGVLYLENNLAPGAFTPSRNAILKLLSLLAAIALENIRLYGELAQAEQALSVSERNLKLTIDTIPALVWSTHGDGSVEFVNQHFIDYVGLPLEQLQDSGWTAAVHPDDLNGLTAAWRAIMASGTVGEVEARFRRADGEYRWLLTRANPLHDANGNIVKWFGLNTDIEDRKRAEAARDRVRSELAHVGRVVSLGALTASIAHEINQPLASIITNGETGLRWLARPEPDLEKVQRFTQRVVDDARRAAEIIARIRTMAGRGNAKRSAVTLDEIVTESTAFLHHEFQAREVSLALDLAPDLPKVVGDRTQLQQVVVNLAINAVQALTGSAATTRKIAIRTLQIDAERLGCIIEDSGPGIDAEHLPHLFDNFFTTKESGMGLGLPIVQSIIEAHHGYIRADNESALGGARFLFELPANSALDD